jgi:hypothetical protein
VVTDFVTCNKSNKYIPKENPGLRSGIYLERITRQGLDCGCREVIVPEE